MHFYPIFTELLLTTMTTNGSTFLSWWSLCNLFLHPRCHSLETSNFISNTTVHHQTLALFQKLPSTWRRYEPVAEIYDVLCYFKEENRAGTGKSESMKDDLIWRKLFLKQFLSSKDYTHRHIEVECIFNSLNISYRQRKKIALECLFKIISYIQFPNCFSNFSFIIMHMMQLKPGVQKELYI